MLTFIILMLILNQEEHNNSEERFWAEYRRNEAEKEHERLADSGREPKISADRKRTVFPDGRREEICSYKEE